MAYKTIKKDIVTLRVNKRIVLPGLKIILYPALLFLGAYIVISLYTFHLMHNTAQAASVSTTYTADHSVILSTSTIGNGGGIPTPFGNNIRLSASKGGANPYTCFISDDYEVWCAGLNAASAFGNGETDPWRIEPTPIRFGLNLLPAFDSKKFIQVSGGGWDGQGSSGVGGQVCGVTTANEIYCSGANNRGQLAIGSTILQPNPILFGSGSGGGTGKQFTQVAAGDAFTCALTTTQQIFCAGKNFSGELGASLPSGSYTSLQRFGQGLGKNFTKVAAGSTAACGVTTDQLIYCSGGNNYGQLGRGDTISSNTPVQFGANLNPSKTFTSVSVAHHTICGLTTDQVVYCSGRNEAGELGDGTTTMRTNPVPFGGIVAPTVGKTYTQVDASGFDATSDPSTDNSQTCVLSTEKLIYCAGNNTYNQLGFTPASYIVSNPVLFGGVSPPTIGKTYSQVSAGLQATCGYGTDQIVYCAGPNVFGNKGTGSQSALAQMEISMILP